MEPKDEIKLMRTKMGMNRKQFSAYFDIPYRTVQDWEAGKRVMPDYVRNLMAYMIRMEEYMNKNQLNASNALLLHDRESDYLKSDSYINWEDNEILSKAKELIGNNEVDTVRNIYYYVRDEIKHSWDVQDKRITVSASDVLANQVGICWAKSNLFAALCRANGIPAGICYQRLTLEDTPRLGYCIHALNAVYLSEVGKWIRLDARGNRDDIHAEFSVDKEQLAFEVRDEYDEIDYRIIYANANTKLMNILEKSSDALYLYQNELPDSLD